MPRGIVGRVQDMTFTWYPFVKASSLKKHDKEKDKREHEMMASETRVRDIMEAVERTITTLFYDRFVPLSADAWIE